MRFGVVIRTLGVMFLLFSTTVVPPAIISLVNHDRQFVHFSLTFLVALVTGLVLWYPHYRRSYVIRNRDGFVIVALMWVATSVLGALPFMLSLEMTFADALFESVSGYTTTGATVLSGLDRLPPSILFYRQGIQWLGGIGVIVLAVALMPLLGVGGMQLYKAETPGPVKDERLTPRIARTARILCVLYGGMTVVCAISYWFAGMSVFDAVAHSLSTMSSGGFSTHDASIAYFNSPEIEAIAIFFMVLAGISFSVHFLVWNRVAPRYYYLDDQVRVYLMTIAVIAMMIWAAIYFLDIKSSALHAFRVSLFEVVSVMTSTGFAVVDFSLWPGILALAMILTSFIGGCSGSTAGGIKVVRLIVLAKVVRREFFYLVHPSAIRPLKINHYAVPDRIIDGIRSFFTIYVLIFAVFVLLLIAGGEDSVTAFGAVAACINNLGPGLGDVATNFASVGDTNKILLSVAMLLGRLEIFTLLILVSPTFWRE